MLILLVCIDLETWKWYKAEWFLKGRKSVIGMPALISLLSIDPDIESLNSIAPMINPELSVFEFSSILYSPVPDLFSLETLNRRRL